MSDFKFPGAPKGYESNKDRPVLEVTARKSYYPRAKKMSAPKPSKARTLKSPPMEVKVVGFSKAAKRLSKQRGLRSL